jgi:hypothetical protein
MRRIETWLTMGKSRPGKGRGRFLNFLMLQFQKKKNIVIFLAVNAKPTPSDWPVQPAFDSHWLDDCANSTPTY